MPVLCLNECIYHHTVSKQMHIYCHTSLMVCCGHHSSFFFESHCHYIIPRGTSIPTCWWHGWWISWGRAKRRDSGMKTWIKVNSKTPQGGVGLLKLYGKNWHRPVSMVTGLSSLCNFQHKGSEGKELSVNDTDTRDDSQIIKKTMKLRVTLVVFILHLCNCQQILTLKHSSTERATYIIVNRLLFQYTWIIC